MLLEWRDDNQSYWNLNYEILQYDAFMDQIEHFLACKSVAVPTCNSWMFDTESHQNHYGSISLLLAVVYLKGTATGFWPCWDCTTDPLPTQAFCFAFWIGELFHFNGCSEFLLRIPLQKNKHLHIPPLPDRLRGMGCPLNVYLVANLN